MSKHSLGGMSSTRSSELIAIARLRASRRISGHGPRVEPKFLVI